MQPISTLVHVQQLKQLTESTKYQITDARVLLFLLAASHDYK